MLKLIIGIIETAVWKNIYDIKLTILNTIIKILDKNKNMFYVKLITKISTKILGEIMKNFKKNNSFAF